MNMLSETERTIAEIWREVLVIPEAPGPTDSFFGLGGDSLTMTLMLFQVGEKFGMELSPAALLESPELRAFSATVELSPR